MNREQAIALLQKHGGNWPIATDTPEYAIAAVLEAAGAKKPHPIKSTTHEEHFFHFNLDPTADSKEPEDRGATVSGVDHKVSWKTVFLRREKDGRLMGSVAYCDARDLFCREDGRKRARSKYFQGKRSQVRLVFTTLYETAERFVPDYISERVAKLG